MGKALGCPFKPCRHSSLFHPETDKRVRCVVLCDLTDHRSGVWSLGRGIGSREALHRAAGTLCRHNSRGRRCFDRLHRGTSDFVSPHDRNLDFRRLSPADLLHWNRGRHIDCILHSRRSPSLWDEHEPGSHLSFSHSRQDVGSCLDLCHRTAARNDACRACLHTDGEPPRPSLREALASRLGPLHPLRFQSLIARLTKRAGRR